MLLVGTPGPELLMKVSSESVSLIYLGMVYLLKTPVCLFSKWKIHLKLAAVIAFLWSKLDEDSLNRKFKRTVFICNNFFVIL